MRRSTRAAKRGRSSVDDKITRKEIKEALAQLDELCKEEYGSDTSLERVLLDSDSHRAELRLQRLTGIILKQPFARAVGPPHFSETGAKRAWKWVAKPPNMNATAAPKELAIISELRLPGPWNERKAPSGTSEDRKPISWDQFVDDVDHERGLFKVLVLYVDDKIKRKKTRSLSEYTEADESKSLEAGLDLATLVFDAAVTAPLASVLGIPALVVGTALVGVRFGYRKVIDPQRNRVADVNG